MLGEELFNEFWNCGQIINHDSEDYEHLVDLGTTDRGDPVLMNKYVYDSDVAILIGHTQGNPYGGYSGGYKHCATGITHWRSIASHHVPKVMHQPDFVPVSGHSMMRTKFDEIGQHMEKCMGKSFSAVMQCWTLLPDRLPFSAVMQALCSRLPGRLQIVEPMYLLPKRNTM